jgi:hypothetical protein
LLVVQQVNKEWDINKETMDAYVAEIRNLENKSDRAKVPPVVFVHELHHPSIRQLDPMIIDQGSSEPSREVMIIKVDWWVPFIDFIKDHKLPPGVDKKSTEAAHIIRWRKGYVLIGDKLYKHGSATGVLMKCVPVEEGKEILQEIYEGVHDNHAASKTLVKKAFRSRYY